MFAVVSCTQVNTSTRQQVYGFDINRQWVMFGDSIYWMNYRWYVLENITLISEQNITDLKSCFSLSSFHSALRQPAKERETDWCLSGKRCTVSLSLSLPLRPSHTHTLRSVVWPVVGVFGTSVSQCGCHGEVTHSLNHTVILFIDVLWQTLEWSSSVWCRSEPRPVCSRSCAAEVILVRGRKVLNIDYSRWSRHADPLLK